MSPSSPSAVVDPAEAGRYHGRYHLASYRVFDVAGEDAPAFLQGQFCNDVVALQPGQAQLTGYCTPKGRLLAAPLLVRHDAGYRLILPDAAIAAAFLKRLSMFVMRAAVTITAREELAVVAVFGALEGQADTSGEGLGDLPATPFAARADASIVSMPVAPGEAPRWLACQPAEQCASLEEGDGRWRLADIRAGVPSVREGTLESFVPQMVNFEEIGALSFTKGCYPGQEIVARTRYLGKRKRRMERFVATGEAVPVPAPGEALGAPGVAEVVDAVATPEGVELLAMVRIGETDGGLALGAATAHPAPLPYDYVVHPDKVTG